MFEVIYLNRVSLYRPQNDVFLHVLQLDLGHIYIIKRAVALKLSLVVHHDY